MVTYANILPKMVNPRDLAEKQKKRPWNLQQQQQKQKQKINKKTLKDDLWLFESWQVCAHNMQRFIGDSVSGQPMLTILFLISHRAWRSK